MFRIEPSNSFFPVFDHLFNQFKIESVLEFGIGLFSTPYLLDRKVNLYSVESKQEWYNKCFQKDNPLHKAWIYPEETMNEILNNELKDKSFDMIFIDGLVKSRAPTAQQSFGRAPLIVWHDTEDPIYQWDSVIIPKDYSVVEFKFYSIQTKVLTNKNEYLEKLNNFKYE